MTDDFERAWFRVALAGRELGSGVAVGAKRVAEGVSDWLKERDVPDLNAGCIEVGVAVGLVMAGDERALSVLKEIHNEWLVNH